MDGLEPELADCGAIGRQLVRGDGFGVDTLAVEQLPQQLQGGMFVAPFLDPDIQDFALVVHGPQQPDLLSADPDVHLIQMPPAGWQTPAPSQVRGDLRAELQRPAADRLIADLDAPLGQQFLDVSEAQRKAVLEPDGMADHVSWEPVAFE